MYDHLLKRNNFFSDQYKRGLIIICSLSFMLVTGCADKEQIRLSALHYFHEGNNALVDKDYQLAIWSYSHAIQLDPSSPEFHYNLGLAYYEAGNYQQSIEIFKQTQEMSPNMEQVYYNLALAYHHLYDSKMANFYYNQYQTLIKPQENLVLNSPEKKTEVFSSQIPPLKNLIKADQGNKNKLSKTTTTSSKSTSRAALNKSDRSSTLQKTTSIPRWDQ